MIGKIKDFNFRELHHRYLLLIDDERSVSVAAKAFPYEPGDNALLLYGYIDHQAGITFEVLCVAKFIEGCPIEYREPSNDTSLKLRYDSIQGTLGHISVEPEFAKYRRRVEIIDQNYQVNLVVEHMRTLESLDECRSPQYPDDIVVYFIKAGCKTEGIWVRLEKNIGNKLAGIILNEPYADFGYHAGEYIRIEPVVQDNRLFPVAIL